MQQPPDILLVEDNPDDVELALHALGKYPLAHRIHVVRDGSEALDYLFARGPYQGRDLGQPPRLILLDLKLPRLGGIEVLRQIKSQAHTQHIPVVMLTASNQERDLVESYRLGVNSYIVKPVDFDQFVEAMRTLGFYWLLLNQLPTHHPPAEHPLLDQPCPSGTTP